MPSLLSSLQSVSGALGAFSQALNADQLNISSASTPGYASVRGTIQPLNSDFGGAGDVVVLTSTGDARVDASVQAANAQASDSQTQLQQLTSVNQQFDITGTSGILAAFQQFSTAFANLATSPGDATVSATALSAAGNVAAAFNTVAQNLNSQSQSINGTAQSDATQINDLATQIAGYNGQIRGESSLNPGVDAARRSALTQLSSLVGITVTQNADGTVNVLAGGSLPLVLADQSYALSVDTSAAPGSQVISSAGGAEPPSFSGSLGGLLTTLNNSITPIVGGDGQSGSLNTLAQSFASTVNTILTSGVTAGGVAGVPIFTYDNTNPANVAATLALDPAVTTAQLAVGTTGANAQSNGTANLLAGLVGSNNPAYQINGQAPQDYYSSIAQGVGQQLSDATRRAATDQTSLTSTQANQAVVEGVSLDQEAVNITADQRAWEAAAKLVTVMDNLTLDAVNLVGQQYA